MGNLTSLCRCHFGTSCLCPAISEQGQSDISLPLPLWYKLLVPSDFGTGATLGAYITPEQHSDMMKKMALKKGKSIHELTLEDFNEFVEESLHESNPFNQISIDYSRHAAAAAAAASAPG